MPRDAALLDEWHVMGRSSDLDTTAPLSARLLGEDLVLWRDGNRIMAWQDLCVHRGTRLSLGRVEDGCLICPYHGWSYNAEGRCVLIPAHPDQPPPARARAVTYAVQERYGLVWVSLGTPSRDPAPFPEWDDPAFRKVQMGPYAFNATPYRVIENALDVTHFPFVHSNLLGDPRAPDQIDDYDVDFGPDGITTSEIRVFQQYGDARGVPIQAGYTYKCPRLLTVYFSKKTGGDNRFCTFFTVTPVDEVRSLIWSCSAINFGWDIPEAQVRARTDTIMEQDRRIVETQRPERVPIDLQAELHVRSDRVAIEYRKWLKQAGVAAEMV
jgi:phenylpropionate dioxygenase-like ring-hydroxylating dioxygenase large terminal subunit